ncbi:putative elongator complex protein 1 [Diprion similis]|uniref:putative elongator complex protein 1 n=1 Tax=Diprion similis TaxID=362088 RepID=UPI001EF954A7|nr:putative elongator complex protein 1 [Diprion similis]
MKNLRVLQQSYIELKNLESGLDSEVLTSSTAESLCCLDNDGGDFYVYKNNNVYHITTGIFEYFHLGNENVVDSKLVGFAFCDSTRQIYLAYSCGRLFTIEIDLPDPQAEFAAQINEGLCAMKLSPDHEIVTLVTSNDTVIVMTSGFHVITEFDLNSTTFGEKQFVTVGWGKKETQFHGSEGKSAAKAKPLSVEKSESDDGLPRVSWRGDSMLFAVSFLTKETNVRLFKVFSREGVLQYTSEPSSGLEENLAWKPSGNLIAITQRFPNKHVVSFFEKNGLKHREFTLPFEPKEIMVKDLQWSTDSDIIAIWCININDGSTRVQLWTENNYHWYLKQTLLFSENNPLLHISWSTISGCEKKLLVLTKQKYLVYTFCWTVSHSRGKNQTDKALVGVIDGDRALLTGFRDAVVPPPMAHQALQIDEPINEVVFAPEIKNKDSWINSNVLFTLLENNRLAFYKQVPNLVEYGHIKTYEVEWEIPNPISESVSYSMHHYLWYNEDTILCAAPLGLNSVLCIIHVDGIDTQKNGRLVVRGIHTITGAIQHIVSSPDPETVYIVAEGCILTYSKGKGVNPTGITVSESCHQVEVIQVDNKHIVLCLSEKYCLFVDGKEIANNITSFFVHTEFLLLTTLQHVLISIALDGTGFQKLLTHDLTVEPREGVDNEKMVSGLSLRRIERGSKLIMAVPKDTRTILQMPRGNLECIQPRALSLYVIGTFLNELNYHAAFDLIRKQRINLNLIFDHDPDLFVANAEKFIEDIKNPNWLSLFLSDLQEEDVTSTMYSSCYSHKAKRNNIVNQVPSSTDKPIISFGKCEEDSSSRNKVEHVCELLRNHMEARLDADRLLLPILTSLVKKHEVKDLEAALVKVKEIKKLEKQSEAKLHSSSEEALKYLLYLVDVNTLFDIALGMYDFDLVMLVAAKSQKDPKEYVPFLNDLRQLDDDYMRFSIDVHLKRYESALNNISKCKDRFEECKTLIKTQNLYSKALKLFTRNSKEYKDIAEIYGEYLIDSRKYQEAAIMFTRSNNLVKALNAFKLAGDWREAIVIGQEMKLSVTDLQCLYQDLVKQLKDTRKYADAATILMHYLHEPEDTVATLCEGKLWHEALRIAYQVERLDIVETHIKPGVQEHADYMISKIIKNQTDFIKFRERLSVVRAEKSLKELQLRDVGDGDHEFNPVTGESDLFSDTSSIAGSMTSRGSQSSRLSSKSYRSSKNRRKHERKLHSLREGSIYEDLALISALHGIVTTTYADRVEINSLMRILLRFYNDSCAEKLQNLMEELLNQIERGKLEIWPEYVHNGSTDSALRINFESSQPGQGDVPEPSLEPHLRYPPLANPSIWQLEMVSSKPKLISNT